MTMCCVHSSEPAVKGRRYCRRCLDRLRRGYEALDGDDVPKPPVRQAIDTRRRA